MDCVERQCTPEMGPFGFGVIPAEADSSSAVHVAQGGPGGLCAIAEVSVKARAT